MVTYESIYFYRLLLVFTRQPGDNVSNNNHDVENANRELTKKILQLEIAAMKSSQKMKSLEQKLKQRTEKRDVARKKVVHFKNLYEKERSLPMIRSSFLNVSC